MSTPNSIDFNSELKNHILGNVQEGVNSVEFIIYSNYSPAEKDLVWYNETDYECTIVIDATSTEESEEGLCYYRVRIEKV